MDKETQVCGLCLISYNTSDRIPRILINCAHTLCSSCLKEIINTRNSQRCPFDDFAFNEAHKSLEDFPRNFALLASLERKKQNICKVHDKELTKICFEDRVKVCSDCALCEEHKGHTIKKVKELKAKAVKVKKELQESLMNCEKDELEKDQDMEILKKRCLHKMMNEFEDINKILKNKQHEWRKQMERLFERNMKSQPKEEACRAIEEIEQAFKNEEYLTLLDRDFSSIISRLKPQVVKEEFSRLAEQISGVISSLESFLVNQAKSLQNFDLLSEKRKLEESI